jgi:hypothetical protein
MPTMGLKIAEDVLFMFWKGLKEVGNCLEFRVKAGIRAAKNLR